VLQDLLRDPNEDIKVSAVQLVGLLATNAKIRSEFGSSDVVSIMCKGFLGNPDEVLARSYLAALRNVATDRSFSPPPINSTPLTSSSAGQAIHEIIDSGAIKKLIKTLRSEDDKMIEQAAGVVMNMANNDDTRTLLCEAGVVEPLAELLEFDSLSIIRTATSALTNIGSTSTTKSSTMVMFANQLVG